jgi:hypothetical protein
LLVADCEQAFAIAGEAREPFAVTAAEPDTDTDTDTEPESRPDASRALSADPAIRIWIRERDDGERCKLLCQGDAAQRK